MSSSSSSTSSTPERSPPRKRKRDANPVDSDSEDSSDSDGDDSPQVPALSHAERRRQKKKEKLEAKEKEASESPSKKQKLQDGTSSTVPGKRQNSVWVGNMSFKTTPESLKAFFEGVGEITRVNMPTKAPAGPGMKGENRGFAYVDFATAEAKAAAIARSEQPLIGRRLLIKDGDDFTGRPALPGVDGTAGDASESSKTHSKTAQKILRSQKQPPAPTLFLGNLGFETTEKSISELLEAHRSVKKNAKEESEADAEKKDTPKDVWIRKIRMGTFEDSGLCKGFAFVDFTTIEHATSALINPKNHHLDGRKLVVEYASADAVRRGAPKPKREEGAVPMRQKASSRGPRGERKERQRIQESLKAKAGDAQKGRPNQAELADDARPSHRRANDGAEAGRRTYSSRATKGGKEKGPRVRPKPGAALALAKRESVAILPRQGQKITF